MLGGHHHLPGLGEHRLLAGNGIERAQLLRRMLQIVAFGLGPLHQAAVLVQCLLGGRGARPKRGNVIHLGLVTAEGIEQAAVCGDVDQRTVGMLAMNLGQRAGDLTQQVQAHRLVVDGRAARTVGVLDAADYKFVVRINTLLLEDCESRMRTRERKGRGDHATLRPCPHQRTVATGAKRQTQRVKQDRLAGTGFTGEHGQPRVESDIELLDQDDVTNGESGQHGPHL